MRLSRQGLVRPLASRYRCYEKDATWRQYGRYIAAVLHPYLYSAIWRRAVELAPALAASFQCPSGTRPHRKILSHNALKCCRISVVFIKDTCKARLFVQRLFLLFTAARRWKVWSLFIETRHNFFTHAGKQCDDAVIGTSGNLSLLQALQTNRRVGDSPSAWSFNVEWLSRGLFYTKPLACMDSLLHGLAISFARIFIGEEANLHGVLVARPFFGVCRSHSWGLPVARSEIKVRHDQRSHILPL